METKSANAREWMLQEFSARKKKNPSLSLRAFARYLNIPASRLSEIFSGKRPLTAGMSEKIAERLAYEPTVRGRFLGLVQSPRRKTRPLSDEKSQAKFKQLSTDAFCTISEWYHFAILSLIETANFDPRPNSIAKRLGISVAEVRLALGRLERLRLIRKDNDGWIKTEKNITTTNEVRSTALRHGHRQLLEKSILAIDDVDIDKRDITSMTMAIDPSKLKEAKKVIARFRRDLCEFLESENQKEVYSLCIQLVPLSVPEEK